MKTITEIKDLDKKQFTKLAFYYASRKHSWLMQGTDMPTKELKILIAMQKLTNELYPELNYLFKK